MQRGRGDAARRGEPWRNGQDGRWRRVSALAFAGAAMVGMFAFAGYHVGNVAVARSVATVEPTLTAEPAPALRKGSLFATTPVIGPEELAEPPMRASLVPAKGDILIERSKAGERGDRLARVISPPVDLLEEKWEAGREERRRVAEHKCLSQAIYFEARSESEIGRLAVARVILNRVKSPFFPDTICGVVYQNAERRNACQFSFACNGKSDRPRPGKAWERSKTLATRAMSGDGEVKAIATATHYHADYVQPKWSGAMTRLIKIGRHIFYSGS